MMADANVQAQWLITKTVLLFLIGTHQNEHPIERFLHINSGNRHIILSSDHIKLGNGYDKNRPRYQSDNEYRSPSFNSSEIRIDRFLFLGIYARVAQKWIFEIYSFGSAGSFLQQRGDKIIF